MDNESTSTTDKSLINRLKLHLESQKTHWIILFFVAMDVLCFMTMIIITLLWPNADQEEHWIIETLTVIAFGINAIFLLEIILNFIVFGLAYFTKGPHWVLHIFDAILVFATFILEVSLHGKQREVVGLLIIFRFWRLIKVVGTVAVGVGTYNEQQEEKFRNENKQLEEELERMVAVVREIAKEDNWNDERMEKVFQGSDVKLAVGFNSH
ncbi:14215_t:CDS:1 [Racocetra persica]|uniref:14215_t:CDS:1 n=1 Tax=Racocetra persica TaxID=160502 RepID=A0ACA9QY70_9GLOM|nr:14215_t:CDS:1 [Racocetra persica]